VDKRKISIILALALALVAVVMLRNWINQTEKKYVKEEKKAYVLEASTNIPAGTTIDGTMIRFDTIPEKYVQPKAVNSEALIIGKRAIADIFAGEQIMSSKLTITVKDTSVAMRTPQGKRAITITISALSAVAGKVKMGDYVDIIGTFPYNAQVNGKTVTEIEIVKIIPVFGDDAALFFKMSHRSNGQYGDCFNGYAVGLVPFYNGESKARVVFYYYEFYDETNNYFVEMDAVNTGITLNPNAYYTISAYYRNESVTGNVLVDVYIRNSAGSLIGGPYSFVDWSGKTNAVSLAHPSLH